MNDVYQDVNKFDFSYICRNSSKPTVAGKHNSEPIDLSERARFQAEYEEHFSALKYFALHYIGDEEVVCDLLQDFFAGLWERGETFGNKSVFKSYLYRSVRNNCLCYLRDERRRECRMAAYEPEETEAAFVDRMIESEIYALMNEMFEELPPATREVYRKSLEGKSHQEIAEEFHIAVNTVKKHKNNANRYLRTRLEKFLYFLIYFG